jgi:uncharacterized membrane protein
MFKALTKKLQNIVVAKKRFFNRSDELRIMAAIADAEKASSGEVRVFVESVHGGDVRRRAVEVFNNLKMTNTRERNGVLIYLAMKDRQFAIFGDEGIHEKLGFSYWTAEATTLQDYIKRGEMVEGICHAIRHIGDELKSKFPYQSDDVNELPDEIAYGD